MVLPWCFLWATVIAHVVCSFPIAVISHHKLGSVKQHTDSLSCGAGGQRPRRVFPRLWSRCGQDLVPPRGCTGKFCILDFSPFLEVVYSSLVCGPLHPQSHKAPSHLSDSLTVTLLPIIMGLCDSGASVWTVQGKLPSSEPAEWGRGSLWGAVI